MVGGQLWSEDESRVLVAIFNSNDFSVGDDDRLENHRMAEALDRTPSAIDWQWRNIDGLIKRDKAALNVGANVIDAVADFESDPKTARLVAIEICRRNGWTELIQMIGIGSKRLVSSEESNSSPLVVSVEDVPVAAMNAEWAEVERLTNSSAIYREATLTERFRARLLGVGHEVTRYRITFAGLPPLYTDLADATSHVLYEAKGSSDRMSVRLALGQVLDYGRCLANMDLAVLLPNDPVPDLVGLLFDQEVGCIVEQHGGGFIDLTGLNRCP